MAASRCVKMAGVAKLERFISGKLASGHEFFEGLHRHEADGHHR